MRVRIKNDLSKWDATRELRKRPANITRKEWSQRKQTRAYIIGSGLFEDTRDADKLIGIGGWA